MKASLYLQAAYRAFISPAKPKVSYSQYAEDLLIRLALPASIQTGFYVDVGCHHPRRGSNTYALYRKGWHGILIDLEEVKVAACRLCRRRDKALVAAVSDREQEVPIYSPGEFSTNTTINLSSIPKPESYQPIGQIHTTTLTNLLDTHQAPQDFELLSVDVEGVDYEVIKGLDFERYRPHVICVENWESARGIEAIMASPTHRLLADKQYRLTGWAGFSTIYKRNEEGGELQLSKR